MGNRVKGRVKKKSIKAALSSKAGSKRKLSRMGKKQKKEHSGLEASFIGRSKCLKMLQITIKDFRRLCILKGVYPREPLGRVPGNKKGQSFYHIKDIRAIAHEPLLEKFREFRAYMKKIRRAAGRNEKDEAARKNALVPQYTLHHLVKERYPRFQDALGDLDDALTLSYLFAALPSDRGIKARVCNKAKSLAAAWGTYCAMTSAVTKSFISVKGIYLEASIQNVPIRWIIPHAFTQNMPHDVDYRVMLTFLQFYETLLNFVLFKLYNDIGVRYPFPAKDIGGEVIGSSTSILASYLRALRSAMQSSSGAISSVVTASLQKDDEADDAKSKEPSNTKKSKELVKSVGAALSQLESEESDADDSDDDSVDVAGPLQAALESMADESAQTHPGQSAQLDDDAKKRRRLFEGLTFFLSREVPRGYLELVCLAYGGNVGWEGDDSPISVKDPSITHHIVDRPALPKQYDSLPKSREYIQPQWILDCANFTFLLPVGRYAVGAMLPPHLSPWVDNEEEGYKPAYLEEIEKLKSGEAIEPTEPITTSNSVEFQEQIEAVSDEVESSPEEDDGDDNDDMSEDSETMKKRLDKKRKKDEEEAHALAKTMMSRKATHLYNRMQHGLSKKQAKIEELQRRRKEIESTKEKDATGKTVLKQKVERLKKERKSIENNYSETGGSMKKSKKRKSS